MVACVTDYDSPTSAGHGRTDPDWQRLADYLRAELRRRGWTQADFAEKAGVNLRTVSRLMTGTPRQSLPHTTPDIEDAVDWPPGTSRRILEGGDPPGTETHPQIWAAALKPHRAEPFGAEWRRLLEQVFLTTNRPDPRERGIWDLEGFTDEEKAAMISFVRHLREHLAAERGKEEESEARHGASES